MEYYIGPTILQAIATLERLEQILTNQLGGRNEEYIYLFDKIARLHKAKTGLVSLMKEYPGL